MFHVFFRSFFSFLVLSFSGKPWGGRFPSVGLLGSGSSAAQWNSGWGWCPTSTVPWKTEQEWDLWHNWVVVLDIVYFNPEIWGKWSNLTSTCFSDGLVQPATRKRMVQRSRKLVWKNLYIHMNRCSSGLLREESHWNSGAFSGWLLVTSEYKQIFDLRIHPFW